MKKFTLIVLVFLFSIANIFAQINKENTLQTLQVQMQATCNGMVTTQLEVELLQCNI